MKIKKTTWIIIAMIATILILSNNNCSFKNHRQQNNWQQTNGPYGAIIDSIAIHPNHSIFVTTNTGIFRSNDRKTWIETNKELEPSIKIHTSNPTFCKTNSGVFCSSNHGKTWTPFDQQLNDRASPIYDIEISPDGIIWIATSTGVFCSDKQGKSLILVNKRAQDMVISPLAFQGNKIIFAGRAGSIVKKDLTK